LDRLLFVLMVLEVEVPVNMNFVEGYNEGETVYSQEEAASYFKEKSEAKVVGKKNIEELNVVLKESASSWFDKVKNSNSFVSS
jgi:tagatose-1,6-bisphosphate aldolase